ncbi:MAG: Na(+)-translocating NADH-quinone reductase subunit A [Chitinophagales bacterium]|tara:strand:- start:20120 stop:21763 length:1644 start_codon:yes stop_codon:yes gene_type:complete
MNLSNLTKATSLSVLFSSLSVLSFAQGSGEASSSANSLVILLFTCVMVLVVFLAAIMGDKIIKLAAGKIRKDSDDKEFGLVPSLKELVFGTQNTGQSKKKITKLSRGFDIKLKGKAKKSIAIYNSATYAIKPTDYKGLQPIPKMLLKEGAKVKAGEKIFYDKGFEGVFFTSPVSGELVEIRRAEKRAISEIVIQSDGKNSSVKFKAEAPKSLGESGVKSQLLESGAWTAFVERPFGVIANPTLRPNSIHISCSDTAPLAVDYRYVLEQLNQKNIQTGIDALNELSDKVYLNLDKQANKSNKVDQLKGVEINAFLGEHPAGNVGIQIHHTDPIAKGDVVWTIKIEDVATIGRLFNEGVYAPEKIVALTGSIVKNPHYVKTIQGVNIAQLIEGQIEEDNSRVVSGNVLSGTQISKDGFLGAYDNLISVIEEGNQQEMFGWILPQTARPSISPTFPWRMMELARFDANTNMRGEQRAFVVSGQYEEVLPMDVYPQHLMKAIIKNDFEEMEGLGIYELIEEDIAICEFACTSKQPLQGILREGLDYIRSQN